MYVFKTIFITFFLCIITLVSPLTTPSPPAAPFGVQALCSVVVWYSPEVSCEDNVKTINSYEVRFYDPKLMQPNVTRYVGENRTFYIVTENDKLASVETYVQVIS